MSNKKKKTTKKKENEKQKKTNFYLIIGTTTIIVVLLIVIIIQSLSGKKFHDVKLKENHSLMYSSRILNRLNTNNENVMISDLSLNPSLSIFYQYGNEKVQKELKNYFEQSPEEIIDNMDKIYSRYKDAHKIVNVENSYWINKNDNKVSKEVISTAKNQLHFQIKEKDFRKKQTASEMNSWVKKRSHNKVTGDFKTSEIQSMNSILMGTVYFNEKWASVYEEDDIKDGPFYGLTGETEVTYLNSEENIYLETDKAIGFMKPYKDEGLYFVGIIPTEGNSLDNMNIEEVMNSKKNTSVDVKIPEFEFKYDTQLQDALKDMGITSIFESGNLDKIAKGVYISDIIQKNYIRVDRNGTEAFSLNVMTLRSSAISPEKPKVYLNKPFIFLIYDENLDQVLFMGRVNNL